jgi:hypothetical protein
MRRIAFHPPLFALHTPLTLYAANLSLFSLNDVLLPAAVSAVAATALWMLIALALRDLARAANAATVFTVSFFSFGTLKSSIFPANMSWGVFASLWVFATLALCTLTAWKGRQTGFVTLFLNVAGVSLCALAVLSIARSYWAIRGYLASSQASLAKEASGFQGRAPDIFFILLDGYGRTDVFERLYGFTDKSLIRELQERDFYVADDARSNYTQTELSLASMLNLDLIPKLIKPVGDALSQRFALDRMIDQNRVSTMLRSFGYRYIAISTGFPSFNFESADLVIDQQSPQNLFLDTLLEKTPITLSLERVKSMFDEKRRLILGAFSQLKRLAPKSAAPKFVFAHILSPHPPFVFDEEGRPAPRLGAFQLVDGSHFIDMYKTVEGYRKGYAGQAQYTGKLLLTAVDELLKAPGQEPIIIIVGDHGPKLHLHYESLEETDVNEVFPVITALFVPQQVRARLYPSITPVNIFRVLMKGLFGEDLPLIDDRSYYSTWSHPLDFTDVTNKIAPRSRTRRESRPPAMP